MTRPPGPLPDGPAAHDADAAETVEVDTSSLGPNPSRRRRRRLLTGALAAVLVLAGAGVATGLWLADRADKADLAAAQAAAGADVEVLSRAVVAAEDAFAEHEATLELALAHLGITAVPVRDRLAAVVDAVGQEHVDRVGATVDGVTAALEPPQADGTAIIRTASDGTVTALAVGLDHLAEADDLVATLTAHYRTFPAEERAPARAEVSAEAERFDALAQTLDGATAAVRAAVDEVELAVAAAAETLRTTGADTLGTLEHADEESRTAFQAVLDDLAALAATELPVPWESRSLEQAAAFVGADAALDAYTATAEAARASHVANTPPPPRARSGGGGGNSGRQPRACMKYSAWGGTYIGWCY